MQKGMNGNYHCRRYTCNNRWIIKADHTVLPLVFLLGFAAGLSWPQPAKSEECKKLTIRQGRKLAREHR
jgi:hypothetical protein